MNAWNSVENQLRKWTPRQPSPELKARLFAREEVEATATPLNFSELGRWFVPAFGCFLLVMSSLSTKLSDPNTTSFAATNLMMASSTNEKASDVLYSRSAEHSEKNSVPCTRVEYGFATRPVTSAVGSFLISYTNRLIQ